MSRRLIIRPEAEGEIADAFDWYESRVPGLGDARQTGGQHIFTRARGHDVRNWNGCVAAKRVQPLRF